MIDLQDKYLEIIKKICVEILPTDSSVIFFGSRVTKANRKYSDIDIAIKGNGINEYDIIELKDAFDESDIPVKIDINLYDSLPDFLRKIIDEEGVGMNLN